MRLTAICATVIMLGVAGQALGDCDKKSQLKKNDLEKLLPGNYACASRAGDKWNELHQGSGASGGSLVDYKKGPKDPMDPSKQVGTWRIIGKGNNAEVEYNYGPGQVYTYTVHKIGKSNYSFCNTGSSERIDGIIQPTPNCQ